MRYARSTKLDSAAVYKSAGRHGRRGSVLLLVLVVVSLLSFSAYSFSELMIAEYAATSATSDQIQTHALAESGVEAVADFLDGREQSNFEPTTSNAQLFRHQPLQTFHQQIGRYSIVPRLPQPNDPQPVFGLVDESSKLNLNALPLEDHKRKLSRKRLLVLKGMTEQIADAILDWMDEDDEPSEFGVESSWYLSQTHPYRPAQQRLKSVEELLRVRGVTAAILFGEDTNQNGRLDLNENDGRNSKPDDNADGRLDRGWAEFLTLDSRESNRKPGGAFRINVNQSDLPSLYDQTETALGADAAKFIVAWRLAGSAFGSESQRVGSASVVDATADSAEERKKRRPKSALDRLRQQLRGGDDDDEEDEDSGDTALAEIAAMEDRAAIIKGGLNLSRRAAYSVRSLVDLIGTTVRIDVERRDTMLKSPWSDDPSSIERMVLLLNDHLTTSDEPVITGRINVNEASREVLLSVPEISDSLANAIAAAQQRARGNSEIARQHRTLAWLYIEGLVDIRQLRNLAPYLTTSGDVFRGVSVGHIDGRRMTSTVEFLLDASGESTRVLQLVDRIPTSLPVESW
ncbi:MAG: type II secretory pathway component PulK [Planctomycetaceae bacterium]|jgi:type II secretory pathway component PulK